MSTHYNNTAVAATKIEVKDEPCALLKVVAENLDAAERFVQLFDADADDVAVGTTEPDWTILVPPGDGASQHGVAEEAFSGMKFATGLTIAATTTRTGNGAPTNDLTVNIEVD